MTHEELAEIAKNIRYKPGAKVVVYSRDACDAPGVICGYVSLGAVDAISLTKEIEVRLHFDVPARCDEQEAVRELFRAFLRLEDHECREFFAYRGVRLYDPHIDAIYR